MSGGDVGRLVAIGPGGGAGALLRAALHEAGRLGVQALEEGRELVAGPLADLAELVRSKTSQCRRIGMITSSWCSLRS